MITDTSSPTAAESMFGLWLFIAHGFCVTPLQPRMVSPHVPAHGWRRGSCAGAGADAPAQRRAGASNGAMANVINNSASNV